MSSHHPAPNPAPRHFGGRGSDGGDDGGGQAAGGASAVGQQEPTRRSPKRRNNRGERGGGATMSHGAGGGASSKPGSTNGATASTGGNHHHHTHHHHHHSNHPNVNRNPHRGGPGILWTCETGLERKCRHQATDILQHYYRISTSNDIGNARRGETDDCDNENLKVAPTPQKLTLEQELAMLKKQGKHNSNDSGNPHFPFSVYETKCKGTVLMLCTSPHDATASWGLPSSIIEANSDAVAAAADADINRSNNSYNDDEDSKPPAGKRRCVGSLEDDTTNDALGTTITDGTDDGENVAVTLPGANPNGRNIHLSPWDPLETVLAVIKDARDAMRLEVALATGGDAGLPASALRPTSVSAIPSSRFVTRIIPLQITCYASVDGIQAAFQALLQRFLATTANQPATPSSESSTTSGGSTANTNTTTYMVQSKRRHCDKLRSKDVIDCVGAHVPSHWKVDLRTPDIVVWVEICTNLAGLSIVPSSSLREAFQFNLLQARTATVAAE